MHVKTLLNQLEKRKGFIYESVKLLEKRSRLVLADPGVTRTHGRPHVSNNNPYSESQFKTLKYCPAFPERFGSIQDARAFYLPFFDWSVCFTNA
jgi:hypothetical protein